MLYETKEEFQKTANEGHLMVFEVEDMTRINPEWVTTDIEKKAYENEIRIRLMQGVGGFENAIKMGSSSYRSSIECLQLAEKAVIGAKEKEFGNYFQLLNEGVNKIYIYSRNSFEGTMALSKYLNESEFDEPLKQDIKTRLYEIVHDYSKQLLKRANVSARRIKRNVKSDMPFVRRISVDLEKAGRLKEYGVENKERIDQIKNKAYENGVVFVREFSKKCFPKRASRLEKIATSNERILEK